jgi:hypothetical protein
MLGPSFKKIVPKKKVNFMAIPVKEDDKIVVPTEPVETEPKTVNPRKPKTVKPKVEVKEDVKQNSSAE